MSSYGVRQPQPTLSTIAIDLRSSIAVRVGKHKVNETPADQGDSGHCHASQRMERGEAVRDGDQPGGGRRHTEDQELRPGRGQ